MFTYSDRSVNKPQGRGRYDSNFHQKAPVNCVFFPTVFVCTPTNESVIARHM